MRVIIFDQLGNVLNKFGCSKHLEFPNGVVVNDRQEIFISDNRAHCVKVFDYEGNFLRQIGGEGNRISFSPNFLLFLWSPNFLSSWNWCQKLTFTFLRYHKLPNWCWHKCRRRDHNCRQPQQLQPIRFLSRRTVDIRSREQGTNIYSFVM